MDKDTDTKTQPHTNKPTHTYTSTQTHSYKLLPTQKCTQRHKQIQTTSGENTRANLVLHKNKANSQFLAELGAKQLSLNKDLSTACIHL